MTKTGTSEGNQLCATFSSFSFSVKDLSHPYTPTQQKTRCVSLKTPEVIPTLTQ